MPLKKEEKKRKSRETGRFLINSYFFYFLLFIFYFSISPVSAQYRFDSWTTDNGLPQVSVNSILQTRDGFLWLTTFGGLARYDGLRFEVFNSGNSDGLKSSRLLNLYETQSGELWITIEGRGIVRYHGGIFKTFAAAEGLPDAQVGSIGENGRGDFLINVGGRVFIWKDEKFSEYAPAGDEPTKNILQRMANGAVWSFEAGKLQKFENGRVTVEYESEFPVSRSFEDSQGRVWLARVGEDGLAMLKDNRLTVFDEKDGFGNYRFTVAREDHNGAIWFGSGNGLFRFQNNSFTHYRTADGLTGDGVTTVFQDREGTIWAGTSSGLNRLTTRTITTYSTADGLAGDNIYPIYEDHAGRIWLGSWFGLSVYENGRFENVGEKFGVAVSNVTALFEDRDRNFWLGAWGGEVKKIKNGQIIEQVLPPNSDGNIKTITQDRAGNIWIGTSRGLVKYKDETLTAFPFEKELSGKQILVVKEDRAGNLWFGTSGGLFRYGGEKLTAFTEKDGMTEGIVRSIYEEADGALWFGSYDNGLYRFKNEKFTHLTTNEGLFDNGAFQIIEDDAGNFWISCNLGIYRVRKKDLNDFADGKLEKIVSIPYNKRDGMLNSECNGGVSPAGIRASDGRLWFPTQKGAAVINPNAVPFNSQPPPVVVESLEVDTKPVNLNAPVEIQPEQTNLEIHYSGLSFINPELVRFKYKLENLDKDWIDAGGRRTAFYSHLPPGKYVFRVIAANRDGVWNETGATLEFKVIAPFWRTWWFYALVSLAVIGVVVGVFRLRESELRRRQRVQEQFSRKLLESQEQERKRIASEMHDSLGQYLLAIKNWAMFGLNSLSEKDAGREYLTEVSETSSLAIDEVREIAHNLRPYQLERLGLTNTLEYLFKNFKNSSAIEISYEIEDIDGVLSKPDEIVFYRIVQETLNNVIKHSEAENARLSVKLKNDFIEFACRDDGRGFDFETAKNSAKSGLGLNGIAERVKILKGEYRIESADGRGTIVTVKIGKTNE